MKDHDSLNRLFRSAARVPEAEPLEISLGFDTRVVALWRADANAGIRALGTLVRRTTLLATAVTIVAAAAVYYQIDQNRELSEPSANEFAIADTAIQDEFAQ
jgi:hypothetical protein